MNVTFQIFIKYTKNRENHANITNTSNLYLVASPDKDTPKSLLLKIGTNCFGEVYVTAPSSVFTTKSVTHPKIQEISSLQLINCFVRHHWQTLFRVY